MDMAAPQSEKKPFMNVGDEFFSFSRSINTLFFALQFLEGIFKHIMID